MNSTIRTTARTTARTLGSAIAGATHALVGALIDGSEPADQTPDPYGVRAYDMREDGRVYWFGSEAVVGCEVGLLASIGAMIDTGSFKARRGVSPESVGITVTPFLDGYRNPSSDVHSKNARLYDLWALAAETVLTDNTDEVMTAVAVRRNRLRAR